MKKDYVKDLKVSAAPDSEMIIEGEIPFEILKVEYEKIYKVASKTIEIPGFRAGKAPAHLIKANINEFAILDKAAEEVFKGEYPKIVEQLKLFPIDHPKIEITKLALENPLGFKITIAVMPKIELPDYKKITKETNKKIVKKDTEVTEKEVNEAIDEIKKMWAHQEHHRQNPDKEHSHDESFDHLMPEITDEFVKKLGDFKDVSDFNEKIKKSVASEKTAKEKDKTRLSIVEALVNEFTIELPKVFIESELDKMVADLNSRISSAGVTPSEYYKQINKTEADMRTEWKNDAIKRVKTEIVLAEIAKRESIKPEKDAVDAETKKLVEHYKDTDPERARSYVEHMLTNDKVFGFLETL